MIVVGGSAGRKGERARAGNGGVERGEGGRALDDDGGGVARGYRRKAVGGVTQAQMSMGNQGVSGRKGGKGRELTGGNSTLDHLRTVSRNMVVSAFSAVCRRRVSRGRRQHWLGPP